MKQPIRRVHGWAFNALPQVATARVNCRALPQKSIQSVTDALTRVMNDPEVVLTKVSDDVSAPPSPLRKDVMDAITRANNEVFPGVPVLPILVTGATDGRRLRAIGIPTCGAWGLFVDLDDLRAHGRDKRLAIDSFYKGQAFLYRLITLLTVPSAAGNH